uniref:7TM GPCR serpentine receptor class x (Srx) domain-containing protein n=1 Tax=Romanomermis culicivorax TaxID=13658 RepID=A0A915HXQ6_ROMCU
MCIGATRIIAIGFKTPLEKILTRKVKIVTLAAIWTPYTLITGGYMFNDRQPAGLNFQVYTWWYITEVRYGYYMNIYYAYHGIATSIAIVAIDTVAIILIRRKLHTVHPNIRSMANRKREMKLLMQCLITSIFYSFTALVYSTMYESDWGTSLELQYYAIFHLIWIVNHSCSSVIYFLYNQDLIRTVKKFLSVGNSIQ